MRKVRITINPNDNLSGSAKAMDKIRLYVAEVEQVLLYGIDSGKLDYCHPNWEK